jgi:hypothetical protein
MKKFISLLALVFTFAVAISCTEEAVNPTVESDNGGGMAYDPIKK